MENETILCVSPVVWDSIWGTNQQIMSRIARQNRVLYFEPGRDPDRSHLAELRRNAPNFFALRARQVHENLIVVPTPWSLPQLRRQLPRPALRLTMPLVSAVNTALLARHIRRAIKRFKVEAPILWLYDAYGGLVGKFGEKLVCYYNYDEFSELTHNERVRDLLRQADDRLSKDADVVFATSRAQWQRRKALNPDSYFVPNGVDFALFHSALSDDLALPHDLAAVPRPIIGYAGWLSHYIDVELLRRVAEAFPACSLVLVGPHQAAPDEAWRRLQSLPNVYLLGRKERHDLPHYLRLFDVALMPYGGSEHLRSAYPLKLHEYLAAGRAIVATALPELQPFREVVRIAETHAAFIEHIRAAMHDYAPEVVAARTAVARENTWDQRVAEIYRLLQDYRQRKQQVGQPEAHRQYA